MASAQAVLDRLTHDPTPADRCLMCGAIGGMRVRLRGGSGPDLLGYLPDDVRPRFKEVVCGLCGARLLYVSGDGDECADCDGEAFWHITANRLNVKACRACVLEFFYGSNQISPAMIWA